MFSMDILLKHKIGKSNYNELVVLVQNQSQSFALII